MDSETQFTKSNLNGCQSRKMTKHISCIKYENSFKQFICPIVLYTDARRILKISFDSVFDNFYGSDSISDTKKKNQEQNYINLTKYVDFCYLMIIMVYVCSGKDAGYYFFDKNSEYEKYWQHTKRSYLNKSCLMKKTFIVQIIATFVVKIMSRILLLQNIIVMQHVDIEDLCIKNVT